MTEQEWLACDDTRKMLGLVRGEDRKCLPARRHRLFGVACCRRIWSLLIDARSRNAVEVAERYADGVATVDQLHTAWNETPGAEEAIDFAVSGCSPSFRDRRARLEALGHAAEASAESCYLDALAECVAQEALAAAKAAGIPGEPVAFAALVRDIFGNPFRSIAFDPAWRTDTAVTLARQMYESREFGAMPILADALQDAGCDNPNILNHCRDASATHVRGCWVVDLVLGKE
jgi:hypothetical protein